MLEYLRNILLTMKLNDITVDDALNDLDGFECSICDYDDVDAQRDLTFDELEMLEEHGVKVHWRELEDDN